MTAADGVQYSPDGNYWWDGATWQLVDPSQTQADQSGGDGQQAQAQIDWWGQYPAIMTVLSSSSPEDYYQKLGIDPRKLEAGASEGN